MHGRQALIPKTAATITATATATSAAAAAAAANAARSEQRTLWCSAAFIL